MEASLRLTQAGSFLQGERHMPRESIEDLKERIEELESENDALRDQVDSIADIIEGEDEGGED
jgi:prefoldin subunit 5